MINHISFSSSTFKEKEFHSHVDTHSIQMYKLYYHTSIASDKFNNKYENTKNTN